MTKCNQNLTITWSKVGFSFCQIRAHFASEIENDSHNKVSEERTPENVSTTEPFERLNTRLCP